MSPRPAISLLPLRQAPPRIVVAPRALAPVRIFGIPVRPTLEPRFHTSCNRPARQGN